MKAESADIAVVGAGVVGRLMALRLARAGCKVDLYDCNRLSARSACSFAAAGMLSPLAESISGESAIFDLGSDAVDRWQHIVASLPQPVTIKKQGTLVAARHADDVEIEDLRRRIARRLPQAEVNILDHSGIQRLEPALADSCHSGLLLTSEGHIDNLAAMEALAAALTAEPRISLHMGEPITQINIGSVTTRTATKVYRTVVDCRGFGASQELTDLRGVRGEALTIRAPEVKITRPVRILHQRYPVYVVPRPNDTYVVGATCIESDSAAPVSVTGALELLTAVYSLHAGFRHAEILQLTSGVRPAFNDNLPRIRMQAKDGASLLHINGFYRHGWLLAPRVTEWAMRRLLDQPLDEDTHGIFEVAACALH